MQDVAFPNADILMKRTLIINANPKPESLCRAMAERYAAKAREQREVRVLHLGELRFDPNLPQGYDSDQPLEPDLLAFQKHLSWAQHLVIVTPVWWGGIPAQLKGLFDRALLPGYAFRYLPVKMIPEKLLPGRTAEILVTLDTPPFWYRWVQGRPIHTQLQRTILSFVGIRNRRTRYFGPVISSTEKTRAGWLDAVERLAAQ